MTLERSSRPVWRKIMPATVLVIALGVVVAGCSSAGASESPSAATPPTASAAARRPTPASPIAPAPPSVSASPRAGQTAPGSAAAICDPATVKQLADFVSHEWAAQGATNDQLIALNEALFICYFGAPASQCDIAGLAELQLSIGRQEAAGEVPPVADQVRYNDILTACLGQRQPGTQAAGPAPSPASGTDCLAMWAAWALAGVPYLTTQEQLTAFYTALLHCYAGQPGKIPCNVAALAQVQLAMRDVSKGLWVLTAAVEPNVLACFGVNPVLLAGFGSLAAGNGGAGSGGASGGSGPGGGGAGATPAPPVATPTPETGLGAGAPYAVKQIKSLGGEVISGFVCSTSQPFTVSAHTSKVAWVFAFTPRSARAGKVAYAYSIPSAGESHQASGTYTIGTPDHDGTLHLSLTVSDHVVFKGFDGNIPVSYEFDLVPSETTGC